MKFTQYVLAPEFHMLSIIVSPLWAVQSREVLLVLFILIDQIIIMKNK